MSTEELRQDLEELQRLESLAVRPRVKNVIKTAIAKTQSEIDRMLKDEAANMAPSAVPSATVLPSNKLHNYAWDQSEKFVKVYVTLKNAQNASTDGVTLNLDARNVRLVVRGVDGMNHEFEIRGFLKDINPDSSYFKLKTDMVLLMLKKSADGINWDFVTEHEHRVSQKKAQKAPKVDDKADPSASLMQMMKQMYEEGDDDMKRTIKKAWVESQDKKMKGDPPGSGDQMDL